MATESAFYPPFQGDSARLLRLIEFLKTKGWQIDVVHFHDRDQVDADYKKMSDICDSLTVYYPHDNDLQKRSTEDIDDWCPDRFAQLVAHTCRVTSPVAVMAQFVFFSKCFAYLGSHQMLKILDADNIFTRRREIFESAGIKYNWFSTNKAEEEKGWSRADVLLSVQENEVKIMKQAFPEKPVLLVPYARDIVEERPQLNENILFVGALNDENREGLQKFILQALQPIQTKFPRAKLLIAGKVGKCFSSIKGVEWLGVIDDLSSCFRQASIVINTTQCGTGLKTKTIDALCHGKCLVSTPAGVQGLEHYPGIYQTANSLEDFVSLIINLFEDRREIQRIEKAALEFARNYFDARIVFGRVDEVIRNHLSR